MLVDDRCSCKTESMTGQEPDVVQLEFGEGCEELYSEPLVDWLSSQGLGRVAADSQDLTTSCYRGYVVRWVIHSDHLWLDRISNWGEGWIVATPKARIEGDEYVRIENAEEFERRQAALQKSPRPFSKRGLFPRGLFARDAKSRIRAEWFSGELSIPLGESLGYESSGYGYRYHFFRTLVVERGRIVEDFSPPIGIDRRRSID